MSGITALIMVVISIFMLYRGDVESGRTCLLFGIFFELCQINYNLIKGLEMIISKIKG